MDLEQTFATLHSTNDQLRQENDQLRTMLNVVKENVELKTRMQSFNNNSLEELTVCSHLAGRKSTSLLQNTCDERQFRKSLRETKREHRTSSLLDFNPPIQSSIHTDPSETLSCQVAETPLEVKEQERLLGEIAYQLDKRILSQIFQGHRRLYGFTLLNIPDKIIEVSTHPLTGKVDEGYRLHLTERHHGLMERLNQFGYKSTLHPAFAEFIVNTFGILKQKPRDNSTQQTDYNNDEFLRQVITTCAPGQLQKDLLLLLTCLSDFAVKDQTLLFLW